MTTLPLPSFPNPFAFLFNGTPSTQPSTTNAPTTPSTNIDLGNLKINAEEQESLLRLAHAEAGGEGVLGEAAVIKSILNRYALVQSGKVKPGVFGAKGTSLKDIIEAPNQYQPFAQGKLNTPLSAANR